MRSQYNLEDYCLVVHHVTGWQKKIPHLTHYSKILLSYYSQSYVTGWQIKIHTLPIILKFSSYYSQIMPLFLELPIIVYYSQNYASTLP